MKTPFKLQSNSKAPTPNFRVRNFTISYDEMSCAVLKRYPELGPIPMCFNSSFDIYLIVWIWNWCITSHLHSQISNAFKCGVMWDYMTFMWRHHNEIMICYLFHVTTYSISQEICTRFCCALLCCGYAIVHNEFTWSIYPYSSGLLCRHWGNR